MSALARVISVPVRVFNVSDWKINRLFKSNKTNRPEFHNLPYIEAELAKYQEVFYRADQNLLREWFRYGDLEKADKEAIGHYRLMRRYAQEKIQELLGKDYEYYFTWHARRMH